MALREPQRPINRPRSGSYIPISAPLDLRLKKLLTKNPSPSSTTSGSHASNFTLNLKFNYRKSNTKLTSVRSHVYRKEENRIPSTPEWVAHPGLGSVRSPIKKMINHSFQLLTSERSYVYRKEENRNESTPEWVVHPDLGSVRSPIKKMINHSFQLLTSVRSHVYRKEENRIHSTPEWVVHPGLGSARPQIKKILTKNPSPSSTTSGSHASNFMLYLNFNYRKSITKLTSARSYILGG